LVQIKSGSEVNISETVFISGERVLIILYPLSAQRIMLLFRCNYRSFIALIPM
jgi:hypothetical protein